MVGIAPISVESPDSWSHPTAYASLMASAKHYAGLENARALIRESRQIRYLRYTQLAHQKAKASEQRKDSERIEPEPVPVPSVKGEILLPAA